MFQLDTVIPFTFPTVDSYLKLSADMGQRLRVGFHFRTYNKGGLLFAHKLDPVGRAMVSILGFLFYCFSLFQLPEVMNIAKKL